MKNSVLSALKIEDDHPPLTEEKSEPGTGAAEGGDLENGGGSTSEPFEIIPVHDYEHESDDEVYKNDISDLDSDEDYGLDSISVFDLDMWNNYYDQINKSEGFDIDYDVYPGCCDAAPFTPMPYFKELPWLVKDLEAMANLALELFNTEHSTKFKFVEIEKVVQNDWHYYLTFKAKDPEEADANAALKTFQARVYAGFRGPDVELCRIKK